MQEIIVYRNPVEAAFWQSLTNGSFFPVFLGICVFLLVFAASYKIITGKQVFNIPQWKVNLSLALGAAAGIAAVYFTV